MAQPCSPNSIWNGRRIGITGARGALGQALSTALRQQGAEVIGLTHSQPPAVTDADGPNRWLTWRCGEEERLDPQLAELDILVINHGINPQGHQTAEAVNQSLEINALSSWQLMQRFERCALSTPRNTPCELWVNTSEAEIQPAISPVYELTKRLIGQLVSLRGANLSPIDRQRFLIRKLVLGPFRSDLNPIGVMSAPFVSTQILLQARLGLRLIIVTPNPMTYILMPLNELARRIYFQAINRLDQSKSRNHHS